ncbi:MAG: symmetrical bis(5'-nucleosyl)-tetraphosphatase [Gammaproteobacteria bacterium]|nr:symmetrical bis(5'-nucleosyl)-tetraphosphatase [Gammaproteobacteria bacterium]
MATFAIGDIQGCFDELQSLLAMIQFNPQKDQLWLTGDLVNRGPHSLQVLRFIKNLENKQITVLGNHDLHLLAVLYGVSAMHASDTFNEILTAPDKQDLLDWLRHRPLLHDDKTLGFVMTHAGLAPAWNLQQARLLAAEVETVLRSDTPEFFLKNMYGNQPDDWHESLAGIERLRCIVNYFTRMRFCYADGRLDLNYKGEIAGKPKELIPWFEVKNRMNADEKIIFGHWAALNGKTNIAHLFPLDTGCVWGNCLTAMRLEDGMRFSVKCGG